MINRSFRSNLQALMKTYHLPIHLKPWLLPIAFIGLFMAMVTYKAWISEDAYITLRVVDNFIAGYGPVWNVSERVQVFTHPLWFLSLSGVYALIHQPYFSAISLSLVFSLATAVCLVFLCDKPFDTVIILTFLTMSRAFTDYSTSGLENPATHLLLVIFLFLYLRPRIQTHQKRLFFLGLIAALLGSNRLDILLMLLPALMASLWEAKSKKSFMVMLAAFTPLILWEIFSVWYYGFPFPNTYYAKLNTGIPGILLIKQGLAYFHNSLIWDPLTLVVILVSIILAIWPGRLKDQMIASGVILYLAYVLKIGGDFMSGRFFAAPFLAATILFTHQISQSERNKKIMLLAAAVVLGLPAFSSLVLPISPSDNYYSDTSGISDERAYYNQTTGLLAKRKNIGIPSHPWAKRGLELRQSGKKIVILDSIGMKGYYAGPQIHILDRYALADPLLARLPVPDPNNWRIGHFGRVIPTGYRYTLERDKILIQDQALASYYDHLQVIVRAPLGSKDRLITIWEMNLGKYDFLIEQYLQSGDYYR